MRAGDGTIETFDPGDAPTEVFGMNNRGHAHRALSEFDPGRLCPVGGQGDQELRSAELDRY